jgi:hypothetical protein
MYSPLIDERPSPIQDGSQELQFGLWVDPFFNRSEQWNISYLYVPHDIMQFHERFGFSNPRPFFVVHPGFLFLTFHEVFSL